MTQYKSNRCDDIVIPNNFSLNDAWMDFCSVNSVIPNIPDIPDIPDIINDKINDKINVKAPIGTPLSISTKTIISHLNQPIDLNPVFWKIPVIEYHLPQQGVVKKQIKFNSVNIAEVNAIVEHKKAYDSVDDYIIKCNHEPTKRAPFKDVRKISIGICKKDVISHRSKQKSAFYNCLVMILRILKNGVFKEFHVKVFNTGKLEIPGIQDDISLDIIINAVIAVLTPLLPVSLSTPLACLDQNETVMINSNFNCGYYINREIIYSLFRTKYDIISNYDPCSYPGIQCEFYYDTALKKQTGVQPHHQTNLLNNKSMDNKDKNNKDKNNKDKNNKDKNNKDKNKDKNSHIFRISFMIFRTGSVLIVGKCPDHVIYEIYDFLKNMFIVEYNTIRCLSAPPKPKDRVIKLRKKIITVYTNKISNNSLGV